MKLTVIVPVYNEKETILEILKKVKAEGTAKQIIIVDDGSSDGTQDILRNLEKAGKDNIEFLYHERNQGKGQAIKTAIPHITGDYTIIQDADLEYDPDDYARLLDPVNKGKAVVVYGSRFTGERRDMLFFHMLGNKFLSLLTNILYNTTLSDMETCYKLIKSDLLKDIKLNSRSFEFEPEVTAKILKRKVRIYEVPVSYAGREFHEGKKITWRDGFSALWALLKYKFTD